MQAFEDNLWRFTEPIIIILCICDQKCLVCNALSVMGHINAVIVAYIACQRITKYIICRFKVTYNKYAHMLVTCVYLYTVPLFV